MEIKMWLSFVVVMGFLSLHLEIGSFFSWLPVGLALQGCPFYLRWYNLLSKPWQFWELMWKLVGWNVRTVLGENYVIKSLTFLSWQHSKQKAYPLQTGKPERKGRKPSICSSFSLTYQSDKSVLPKPGRREGWPWKPLVLRENPSS